MEPMLPTPNNIENQAAAPNVQAGSGVPPLETSPNSRPEQAYAAESLAASAAATSVVQPVAVPTPVPVAQPTPASSSTTDDPLIADDVDVIEKEWVDKAKKIVSATKADPHQQEKDVSKLQADYLLKRYNKQVKLTE